MSRALQIYHRDFDADFLGLSPEVRRRIEERIDEMGADLRAFPHYRMTGTADYRVRVGDYRVIYDFDARQNHLHLLSVGHRREIYR